MSYTYAGSNAFPTPITLPDDGDPASAASVDAPFQDLADRTVWAKTRIDALDAVVTYGVLDAQRYEYTLGNAFGWGTLSTAWTKGTNQVGGATWFDTLTAPSGGWKSGDIIDVRFISDGALDHAGSGVESVDFALHYALNGGSYVPPDATTIAAQGYLAFGNTSGSIPVPLNVSARLVLSSGSPITAVRVSPVAKAPMGGSALTYLCTANVLITHTVYRARA